MMRRIFMCRMTAPEYVWQKYATNESYTYYWNKYSRSSSTRYKWNRYYEDVVGTEPDEYPANGRHTDGYWYVRGGEK